MNKGLWIGAGLGGLVLILAAGAYWWLGPGVSVQTEPTMARPVSQLDTGARQQNPTRKTVQDTGEGAVVVEPPASSAETGVSSQMSRAERRELRKQLRADISAATAPGKSAEATAQDLVAVVEKLGQMGDARSKPHYEALHKVVRGNAKVQLLAKEFEQLSKNQNPADHARKLEVVAEMRMLGEQVQRDAQAMQQAVAGAVRP